MTQLAQPVDLASSTAQRLTQLQDRSHGVVHLPGSPEYDQGRFAWNVAVDQLPGAVALPQTFEDLCRVVRHAARLGLRITTQTTGHGASVLAEHDLSEVVLVRTSALRGVHIDPERRVARVESGAIWQDVVDAAAPHGLAAMHGSAHDVGVAGYVLGGGMSWYARQHGFACNNIVAIELVTHEGEIVRADAHHHPDLFWALRGGGGNFGVVTTIELNLLPYADVYAGMMLWPIERAPELLRAYADWSATAPDEVTASWRILRFPPLPDLPDFLRGRSVVVLDGAVLLDDDAAAGVLAPFKVLAPELDTFARVPSATLTQLHMDPPQPTPGVGGGAVLQQLDEATVETFLDAVGPGAQTSLLMSELRLLGGALGRVAEDGGVFDHTTGSHVLFFMTIAPTPEAVAGGEAEVDRALAALAPHTAKHSVLNFTDRPVDVSLAYSPQAWQMLHWVKQQVDPGNVFLGNHAL
ncbi:FAD-binding oxidoreductase [Propionibacteriaceae bacterium G57]|uniref:FAD-binding oxidoreductase n=1 Tax=Aestuariimicrobium sp. G57 TaxID=3418485 RepID=UPI003DA71402